jgi:hypothetical protein
MDLTYIKLTDADLVDLAKERSTTREAKREIQRRKMVGFWDGTVRANWKVIEELDAPETEERVYAPGVKKVVR